MDPTSAHRVDRHTMTVVRLDEQEGDNRRFWRAKTPHERLEALEKTRQVLYGYDPATARLQRVLEIARRT